ncbi:hypothetical protein PPTG_09940 [Phytophthora nicotianae INRA-310]|uniref:Cas12f1-like TNB domain-containing protein n=1 Tax=Phytophthora nicotianae (strain INRA-310) TaxID=761204 RepID=W2QEE5_PHYN3|nr:hypothetical protein PPTG_09940 [Phytophthora nicotianae INRA-310]ETN10879.1 hypothetical protein PPTG_09940 [Phytophthora nicotianae INRA-310]
MKSKLALMDNESKAKHETMIRQGKKTKEKKKTQLHQALAANHKQVLLPSFNTSEMARKYEKLVTADGTPPTSSDEVTETAVQPRKGKKREIRSSTARAMLAQLHFKFNMLLKYKMECVGGRMIECEEEYTSKTCSSCGEIKDDLGGSSIYRCLFCHVELDRDVNAAKNIFHKNMPAPLRLQRHGAHNATDFARQIISPCSTVSIADTPTTNSPYSGTYASAPTLLSSSLPIITALSYRIDLDTQEMTRSSPISRHPVFYVVSSHSRTLPVRLQGIYVDWMGMLARRGCHVH